MPSQTDSLEIENKRCDCGAEHGSLLPITGPGLSRRQFFRVGSTGVAGYFFARVTRPLEVLAKSQAPVWDTARNCIFVFLAGAPSHIDTFDLKEGPWTPANFAPEDLNGIRFPVGLLPNIAEQLDKMTIVRSVQAKALVHQLASVWAQIGRNPTGALGNVSPNIGAVVALEAESRRKTQDVLPGFVALNAGNLVGAGYFSSRYAPFSVVPNQNGLAGLSHPDGASRFQERWNLILDLDAGLRDNSPYGKKPEDVGDFYDSAYRLMSDPAVGNTFRFSTEDRNRYGNTGFGNACVTARNLLAAYLGTRFITLTLGGWDHHNNIYGAQGNSLFSQSRVLDPALANLIKDLAAAPSPERPDKTLLDDTLVVIMGEFGRTVGNLNPQGGRDHFLRQFAAFAGGGIKAGRVLGRTDDRGVNAVEYGWVGDRDVRNEDISATIYSALGIDWATVRYDDPIGRGFEYVPQARDGVYFPIDDLFK